VKDLDWGKVKARRGLGLVRAKELGGSRLIGDEFGIVRQPLAFPNAKGRVIKLRILPGSEWQRAPGYRRRGHVVEGRVEESRG
jgi:hypothetical protein